MTRTIYVSGGATDYAVATLEDSNGNSLSGATIQVGLSTSMSAPPTVWVTPDAITYPAAGQARVSLLLNSTNAPAGRYFLWLDVVDSPTSQPVVAGNSAIRTI